MNAEEIAKRIDNQMTYKVQNLRILRDYGSKVLVGFTAKSKHYTEYIEGMFYPAESDPEWPFDDFEEFDA